MSDPDNSGSDRAAADVLVLGGIVITMDERRTILPDGALAIRGGSILALGPRAQIAAGYSASSIVDSTGCLVIPGLIDAHTHIPMTLFRGLAGLSMDALCYATTYSPPPTSGRFGARCAGSP